MTFCFNCQKFAKLDHGRCPSCRAWLGGEWNDPANIGPKTVDFALMRPRRAKP